MKNKTGLILGILGLIGLVGVLLYFFSTGDKYKWYESYKHDGEQPYDFKITIDVLQTLLPKQDFNIVKESIKEEVKYNEQEVSNYLFIGHNLYLDSTSLDHLLTFVDKGNSAFIVSKYIPYEIIDNLIYDEVYIQEDSYTSSFDYHEDSVIYPYFLHPNLKREKPYEFRYKYRDKYFPYYWEHIDLGMFYDSAMVYQELGKLDKERTNFVRVKHGDGYFYFHSNPILFTNFFVIDTNGYDYLTAFLTHFGNGAIYWDEKSKIPDYNFNDNTSLSRSPLNFILSEPALKWAWYILLSIALLFMLFRAKRQQQIIPVLPANENTSLDFVNTIGRLYFLQKNNKQLAERQSEHWFSFIRKKYGIATTKLDKEFIKKLSVKSELPSQLIQKIIDNHFIIEKESVVSDETLIYFHQLIQEFYNKAK